MRFGSTKTRRLVLRPYRRGDYQAWVRALSGNRPSQYKYDRGRRAARYCTRADFLKRLSRYARLARADDTYVYAVFRRVDGDLVGVVDIHVLCREDRQWANLGYVIFNAYWRRGYAKEAVRGGFKMAFGDLGLNRLDAAIDPDNKPSIALAKSLGMRAEGLRKKYLFAHGAWADQVVFTVTARDFGMKPKKPARDQRWNAVAGRQGKKA